MDKNTGTDNVVRRLSGADTIGGQADEIAALRARVEALEAGLEVIAANADMMCCDTATSAMLLRKTLRETRDAARALLEQKP